MAPLFGDSHKIVEPDPRRITPMVQTEDCFASLTHVAMSLLSIYGVRMHPDDIALRIGDCFALNLDVEKRQVGLTGAHALVPEAFADLGLVVRYITDSGNPEQMMRLSAVLNAALRSGRVCIACGGWQPLQGGERDGFWGVVNGDADQKGMFQASTMRDVLLDRLPARGVLWPHPLGHVTALYLVDHREDAPFRPGRLTRRALARGQILLQGDEEAPGERFERLLNWLSTAELTADMPQARVYPYPFMVALRCQFEAMHRCLRRAAKVVPVSRLTGYRQALTATDEAASTLLDAEPDRVYNRTSRLEIETGRWPWAPDAWKERLASLRDPQGSARREDIALVERLRHLHSQLLAGLEQMTSEARR